MQCLWLSAHGERQMWNYAVSIWLSEHVERFQLEPSSGDYKPESLHVLLAYLHHCFLLRHERVSLSQHRGWNVPLPTKFRSSSSKSEKCHVGECM